MSVTINPQVFAPGVPQDSEEKLVNYAPDLSYVSRIYCGRSIPNDKAHNDQSAHVRESSIKSFVDQVLAPLFPNGWTLLHGEGGWRAANGPTIREDSLVIELIHSGESHEDVLHVASEWKRWFSQEAVMVSTTKAATFFV